MYPIFFFIAGLLFTIFGGRVLFETGYLERLRARIWKTNNPIWNSKSGYNAEKYGRGLRYFIIGLMLTIYSLAELTGLINVLAIVADRL